MTDVLNVSTGQSFWTSERLHQDVLNRKFEDGFKLSLMRKDVEIATRLGRETGLDLPFLEAGLRMWREADAALGPDAPVTAFVRYVEQRVGRELTDDAD
jgi:3-hydroxyisobutyrate dehydrogenase